MAALSCALSFTSNARAEDQSPFPDFGFMESPKTYKGPVFKLSQDYPTEKPAEGLPDFFKQRPANPVSTNYADWKPYFTALRDYCFEGNLDVDWRVENNKVRKWYHMPWQHYGAVGREGIHGLTREAPVQPDQLAVGQGQPVPGQNYQTYAVGFFNDLGGYTIGKVWKNHLDPDPGETTKPHGFPEGTVISKLLFVDVPPEQVPSLVNPQQWQAYIQQTFQNTARSIRPVTLIQMDFAVRDNKAPTGWYFGTFQYNGALNNKNKWDNLIPVGIMWGNDPEITDSTYTNPKPAVTKINPQLKESVINPDPHELPPTHLGWNGRLDGPVDNPQSSCMSCHMTAQIPEVSPLSPLFGPKPIPAPGSKEWMRWFQNIGCGEPFDTDTKSTDYNLQLAISISSFQQWVVTQDGLFASSYKPDVVLSSVPAPAALKANAAETLPADVIKSHRLTAPMATKRKIYPIIRDELETQEK